MECAGEDEVVVCADLAEAAFVEAAVVDETAGFVDDDEGEDGPGVVRGRIIKFNRGYVHCEYCLRNYSRSIRRRWWFDAEDEAHELIEGYRW